MELPTRLEAGDRLLETEVPALEIVHEGLEILQQIVRDNLPAEVRIGYTGQSKDFLDSTGAIYVTFAMALLAGK